MQSKFIKDLLPPYIKRKLTGLFYGWSGDFKSWEEAASKCPGYHTEIIFNRVKNALLKVKNGEVAFERDSVLFNEPIYSMPLLASLSIVAMEEKELHVLDFGGSMGSSYFQNRNFYKGKLPFSWSVVEQEHFVTEGKKTFSDDYLNFYYSIDEVLKEKQINVLLLSSVIQYLPNVHEFLEKLISYNFKFIIIDRMPLLLEGDDRIVIQKVPKNIYEASYPCWLLNNNTILKYFEKNYTQILNIETEESININKAAFKAFFLKLK